MTLTCLLLVVISQVPAEPPLSPPPLVSAPNLPAQKDDFPLWQATALATGIVPTRLEGGAFLFGFRAELDVWRISALLSFDEEGLTPFSISELRTWTGMLGFSPLFNRYVRLRALAGLSAAVTDTTSQFGPSLGATGRVGLPFIGVEGGVVFTPFGARQLDLRIEGVLTAGILQLRGGWRTRFFDASSKGTLFGSEPTAGPSVGIGLTF